MNAETYRELEAALQLHGDANDHDYAMFKPLADAARRDLSRWELCPECGGSGFTTGHSGSDGIAVTCSRCQGSGVIPNQERLGAAQVEWDRWFPCRCDDAYLSRNRHASDCINDHRDEVPEAMVRAFDQTGEPS